MNTVTIRINPPSGMSLLSFLEREATLIPTQKMDETSWESIDPKMLPIILIEGPTDKFAYVLYNKEEMQKYANAKTGNDNLKRHYYIIMIDKLWGVTNLFNMRYLIESDRVHSKSKDRVKLAQIRKELLEMIVANLNRSMDLDDIAKHFNIAKNTVSFYAKKLREAGADIPESRKGINYAMFVSNLAKTRPELIKKDYLDKLVDKYRKPEGVSKRRGRPPKKG